MLRVLRPKAARVLVVFDFQFKNTKWNAMLLSEANPLPTSSTGSPLTSQFFHLVFLPGPFLEVFGIVALNRRQM